MRLGMNPRQVLFARERRFFTPDQGVDTAGDQLILDRLKARGALGMPRPHVVKKAI
jgi:hypothetical protein